MEDKTVKPQHKRYIVTEKASLAYAISVLEHLHKQGTLNEKYAETFKA